MSHRDDNRIFTVHFYATAPYPCSYLEDRQARSQVAIPADAIDSQIYSQLVKAGFRRSGLFTYRPYCDSCNACVSVRVPIDDFAPNRSQKRAFKKHATLDVSLTSLRFQEEHYQLYQRYQSARHTGSSMVSDDRAQYAEFILKSSVHSALAEFRVDGELKMVSLIDQLDDGLSAVYTFFDTADQNASYGVYNILWQIELARSLGLPYLYLGYWVDECRKMAYKVHYRPLERLSQGVWTRMSEHDLAALGDERVLSSEPDQA